MCNENIYYNPEAFGLTIVAEIDYSNQSYQFDTRVVWKDKKGHKYMMRDSGCSCPTPFEDYHSVESLDKFSIREIRKEVNEELQKEYSCYITPQQAQEFLEKVRS